MRSMALVISAMLVAGFVLAIAPTATARGVCSDLVDSWCRSAVCLNSGFCTEDLNPDCVMEPCPGPFP